MPQDGFGRSVRWFFVGIGDLLVTLLRSVVITAERENKFFHGILSPGVREKAAQICKTTGGRLLEVGCGDGLFLLPLAKASKLRLVGLDVFDPTFEEAKRRVREQKIGNVSLVKGKAQSLPYREGAFDTVVCINTLNSLQSKAEVAGAIAEMGRICKQEGCLILDFRNEKNPWMRYRFKWRKDRFPESKLPQLTFSDREMRDMLAAAGFEVKQKHAIGLPIARWAPALVIRATRPR